MDITRGEDQLTASHIQDCMCARSSCSEHQTAAVSEDTFIPSFCAELVYNSTIYSCFITLHIYIPYDMAVLTNRAASVHLVCSTAPILFGF